MHTSSRKSEFSVAFVHAVASVAGYVFMGPPQIDVDSVDISIGGRKNDGATRKCPRLDIQVKCTETDDGKGDFLSYPLPVKNYEDLRVEEVHVPHILVVLCVPPNIDDWLHETPEQTAMRRVAYWMSLRGFPEVDNHSTRTISIPRDQRFTIDALKGIMTRIGNREWP